MAMMGGGFVSGVRVRLTLVVAALALVAVACPPEPGPPTGDTTPPVLSLPAPITVAAISVFGATVTYSASASDAVSGPVTPACNAGIGGDLSCRHHDGDVLGHRRRQQHHTGNVHRHGDRHDPADSDRAPQPHS